jgi:hypothetical protein
VIEGEWPSAEVLSDIGHGVSIELVEHLGLVVGLNETHTRPNGDKCRGFVAFEGDHFDGTRPIWRVISKNPLTLEPSILCRSCGNHGFIRESRWVPV